MCSNTSLSSSPGGGHGHSGGFDGDGLYLKKPKRTIRVPKRGPGVAELEKILREQELKYDVDKTKNGNIGGLPLFSPISSSLQPQSSIYTPSSNFLPPDPKSHSPSKTTFSGSGSSTSLNGGAIGGSCIVLPDHVWLPAMWNGLEPGNRSDSAGAGLSSSGYLSDLPNHLLPSPTLIQRSQCLQPPAMINLFPHSSIPSSTTPLNGLGHCTEPPSCQTSNHHRHISLFPEEDKMLGAKRSCPFASDIPLAPPFRNPIPNFCPQMNIIVGSSISTGYHSIMNLESSRAASSDMKTGGPLEQNSRKCNAECGGADGNFLLFAAPGAHSQHRVSKVSPPPIHKETMDDSQRRLVRRGSFQKKPFTSLLLPAEQIDKVETNFSFNNETVDTGGDDIDLNLKL